MAPWLGLVSKINLRTVLVRISQQEWYEESVGEWEWKTQLECGLERNKVQVTGVKEVQIGK